ncbi:hypothetical protein D3C81_1407850 [compost metagenome]
MRFSPVSWLPHAGSNRATGAPALHARYGPPSHRTCRSDCHRHPAAASTRCSACAAPSGCPPHGQWTRASARPRRRGRPPGPTAPHPPRYSWAGRRSWCRSPVPASCWRAPARPGCRSSAAHRGRAGSVESAWHRSASAAVPTFPAALSPPRHLRAPAAHRRSPRAGRGAGQCLSIPPAMRHSASASDAPCRY